MAEPSTPTLPQTGEETARELLAGTVDRVAFPGKAEWILAGHDDVLIDGKDAIRAITAALTHPISREAVARIIDPWPFDAGSMSMHGAKLRNDALLKADQIISLIGGDDESGREAKPALRETWRHVKRGTVYEVLGDAELQDAAGFGQHEHACLTIYRGEDGKLWARNSAEFQDGRFERIITSATPLNPSPCCHRTWEPHRDYAGEWMSPGKFRDPCSECEGLSSPCCLGVVEALEPFAYAAFEADGWPDETAFTIVLRPDDEDGVAEADDEPTSLITARQLRAARTALQSHRGEGR